MDIESIEFRGCEKIAGGYMNKNDILKKNRLLQETYYKTSDKLEEIKSKAISPCQYCENNYLKEKNKKWFCKSCSDSFYEDFY
jgi:hypothetical protein